MADLRPMKPAPARTYKVFVRDLVLPCNIGIYDHEKQVSQRVRINADLLVRTMLLTDDAFSRVLNYETIVEGIRAITRAGHINLVETLAERVAELCLTDPRVRTVRVGVEKLDVYPDAMSVGVAIKRFQLKEL